CTSTDAAGNSGAASFTVTVGDTTAPSVTVPANAMVEATSTNGATYSFTSTATDVVDGAASVTCVPASGALFPRGATTVNCTSTDAAGNTGTASFSVTVGDTTAPLVTVPANATVEATSTNGADYSFTSTATDLVDGATAVSCVPASGALFPRGAT